jgi:hypothetical protein
MSDRNAGKNVWRRTAVAVAVLLVTSLVGVGPAAAQDPPAPVTAPQPTVPEVFTLQGQFVRTAYNNEGFANIGYRIAQEQVGKEWIMLQLGVTLRKPTPSYTLKREHLTITTPDGTSIPLATQQEYSSGGAEVRSLTRRARSVKDSINYFPIEADQVCAIAFFADIGGPGPQLAWDETELSWHRACAGRLFFRIPGGVKVGQHWLNIQFAGSSLQVPFRTLTEEEEKQLRKTWKELKKQHEATYK